MKSNSDYLNIINFLKRFDEDYGISYYVVDGNLKLKNATYFGELGKINVLLSISTHFLYFKKRGENTDSMHPAVDFYCIQESDKILPSSLIRLTDIDNSEIDKSENRKCYIRKGMSFILEDELLSYLTEINFKFLDNSLFTKYKYILFPLLKNG